jgi:hypothetical protein
MQRELSTPTQAIPRGRPAFAEGQRGFVLRKLREAGERGVSRSEFIFTDHVTQCGARVGELKRQGFRIDSELRDGDRYVTYVLRSEPTEPKPLPSFRKKQRPLSGDWFKDATGQDRPGSKPPTPNDAIAGPLFAGVRDA